MVRGIAAALVVGASLLCASARADDLPFVAANGRIAFTVSTGIASMNPDGSGQWGVELQVGDTQPAWSPDGTKLAVVTHWAGRNGIELLQPNGDALGMLTSDGGDSFPAWSPDGRTVAFTNGPDVFLVKADGTGRRQLTNNVGQGYAQRPTWSPDGTTIAYGSYRGVDGQHIYAVDVATGKEKALTSGSTYDTNPAWSPDGSEILFTSTRAGDSGIFSMHPDGTGVAKVASPGVYADYAAWSPDGKQIVFYGNGEIWVMARDGSGAHPLTNGNDASTAAWQPINANAAPGAGCTILGTSANDLLVGTGGSDTICGLGGNDTIVGAGGDDTLRGGSGDDYLAGGTGHDLIFGDDGNDTIDARNGYSDVIAGGPGVDKAILSGAPRPSFMTSIERPRVDGNIAVWMPSTADAAEPTNPPQLAFDGLIQDWWNSGGYAPHWVEVDLQYPRTIGRVQLIAPQLGSDAIVLLLGRSADDQPFRLLRTFNGPFGDLQEVDFTAKPAWRGVRFLRLQVSATNAWVSWREIEVYPPTPAKKPKKGKKK